MRDKMRGSIDMCADVRANMQLGNAPGRSCVCWRDVRFGVARKVRHAVFNVLGQIKILSHGFSPYIYANQLYNMRESGNQF